MKPLARTAVPTRRNPRLAGAELVDLDGRDVVAEEIGQPTVVFIHGFFADGRNLGRFADYVKRRGFKSLVFNYDAHRGVRVAAESLERRLLALGAPLQTYGYVLAGHSMGGLVGRRFAAHADQRILSALRGLLLLGVPNQGIMPKFTSGPNWLTDKFLRAMFSWADQVAGPDPLRTATCPATRQLLLQDTEQLIVNLNRLERTRNFSVPTLSISGGKAHLDTRPRLDNMVLQMLIGEQTNDGLVGEPNADVSNVNPTAKHRRDYPDFTIINHTNLVFSPDIFTITTEWLQGMAFSGASIAPSPLP